MKERQTAIRASVSDILDGEYSEDEGFRVITPQGVELRRVFLLGSIVDQVAGDNNYASITLDDGTGVIRAKVWGAKASLLQKIDLNVLAMVIGRIREYNDEIYIAPEIVKPIDDPNLLVIHKYERQMTILRQNKDGNTTKQHSTREGALESFIEPSSPSKPSLKSGVGGVAGEILQYIIDNDNPDGVGIKTIVSHFEEKGVDAWQINLEILDLVDKELIMEQEVGVYRPID